MLPRRRTNPNPYHLTVTRHTLTAIGVGMGIAGVGAGIGTLYRKPSISIGALVLGMGVTLIHIPWSRYGGSN